jgi:RNA polymerase sigma-70 factor (ECF subfamily)
MHPVPAADPALGQLVERNLGRVYHFCRRMTLDEGEALEAAYQTFARAAGLAAPPEGSERETWLMRLCAKALAEILAPQPEVSFDLLDETLRSEATRTGEVGSLTNPEREFLLWELKQGCMTAVVNCLPPGERVAFVMSTVLAFSDADGARALNIKESAFKVRLSRARKKVGDYLAPRCEHIDPRNPCHCPSRIGIALAKGFIAPPLISEVSLRAPRPPFEGQRQRDAMTIFQTLPEPEPPAELVRRLEDSLRSNVWQSRPRAS